MAAVDLGAEGRVSVPLNVYFAGSIRGGRSDAALYSALIEYMRSKCACNVLTEHVGLKEVTEHESTMSEKQIFDRDMAWLRQADCVVAEVTQPSLGVGYELAMAEVLTKPTLCLFRGSECKLSAMIRGCSFF